MTVRKNHEDYLDKFIRISVYIYIMIHDLNVCAIWKWMSDNYKCLSLWKCLLLNNIIFHHHKYRRETFSGRSIAHDKRVRISFYHLDVPSTLLTY